MTRLAIITTHPIQYNSPLFSGLSKEICIKVFYTWGESVLNKKFDPGFGRIVEWDVDLLNGYDYSFVKNISSQPSSKKYTGIDNPSLINEIENWGATAVLVYGWKFKSHLKALKFFHTRIPVYFRGDSHSINEKSSLTTFLRKQILNYVYSKVNVSFYVGKSNRQYFLDAGMSESQLAFAPHSIDNSFFVRDNDARASWRHKLQIEENALVFLYAGKIEAVKNITLLVESFSKINADKIFLVIAGEGPLLKDVKILADTNGQIKFLPFQNQSAMPGLYSLADVFVLPSISETWGLSVNEAMACGCAVVVSDACGCCADLVVEGVTGFKFSSRQLHELIGRLSFFVNNRSLAIDMGEASLQYINRYSCAQAIDSIKTKILLDAR